MHARFALFWPPHCAAGPTGRGAGRGTEQLADGYAIAPYDDAEIARLRSLGIDEAEDDPSVLLEGPGPRLFLQLVPETKQAKNRCHLDLTAPRIEDEVERLVGLGASVVERHESHVTLTDPQGNEFCVTRHRGFASCQR